MNTFAMIKSKRGYKTTLQWLLAVLLCGIFLLFGGAPATATATVRADNYTSVCEIDLGSYSSNVYLYNHMNYNLSSGSVATNSIGPFALRGQQESTPPITVYIGDYDEGTGDTAPKQHDINTCLKDLNFSGTIVVKPVVAGKYIVNMGVIGEKASTVGGITLENNAKLVMDVQKDLTVTALDLAENSQLEVTIASDATLTVENVTGSGSLTLTGAGTFSVTTANVGLLSAENTKVEVKTSLHSSGGISLVGATVSGENSATVTSEENITVTEGSIHSLALFGYDHRATGQKTITFQKTNTGCALENITCLGAAEDATHVSVAVEGMDSLHSISNVLFVSDFQISYTHRGEEVTFENCVSYRAEYRAITKNVQMIIGTVKTDGTLVTSKDLPSFSKDGYIFNGWNIDGSVYTAVPDLTNAKALALTTNVTPEQIRVTFDHGFTPDKYSHNCTQPNLSTDKKYWSVEGKDMDSILDLSPYTPTRVGYAFQGWKITSGEGTTTIDKEQTKYTVSYADLDKISEDDGIRYELCIEAQWQTNTYTFRFSMDKNGVHKENTEISFDGGTSWIAMTNETELAEHGWVATEKHFSFEIEYGRAINAYFTNLPILRDTTADSAVALAFSGWIDTKGNVLKEDMVFAYAENGMLRIPAVGQSLESYDKDLQSNPMTFSPKWGDMTFALTMAQVTGWTLFVGDTEITNLKDGNYTADVFGGTTVSLRAGKANAAMASKWVLKDGKGELVYLKEMPYEAGASYVEYTFSMPNSTVTGSFTKDNSASPFYFDLAEGAITFAENVEYNNIARNGFWYSYHDKDMPYTPLFAEVGGNKIALSELNTTADRYFYTWDSASFYVTSNNVETQHQLTLVNALTVYLKDCKLIATEAYTSDVKDRKIKDYAIEGRSGSELWTKLNGYVELKEYGNIVLDNSIVNSFQATFRLVGENKVNGIFPTNFNPDNNFNSTVILRNEKDGKREATLHLGTIMGNFSVTFRDLIVKEITLATSEYLVYTNGTNEGQAPWDVYNSKIESPTKRGHMMRGSLRVYDTSQVQLGSVRTYGGTYLYSSVHMEITYDLMAHYAALSMTGDSTCIVGGNIDVVYDHWNITLELSGKYLIVKGAICSIGGSKICDTMVIIANSVLLTNQVSVYGNSTIVANQILNRPVKFPATDEDGVYHWTGSYSGSSEANKNGDNETFLTYSQNSATTKNYHFYGNSKIYLLGYYKTKTENGINYYDGTVKATDADNPIADIIEAFEVNNAALTETYLQDAVKDAAAKYTGEKPECIIIGNSMYDTENAENAGKLRSINIDGKASFYAAGNITFFNTTTISGNPTLVVNGKLASKRSLNISGGTITATSVGNYNKWEITTQDGDGIDRWSTTTITGGTLTVDYLGSAEGEDRTTLVIEGTPTIQSKTEDVAVKIYQDVRVSYIYNEDFTLEDEPTYENIRITGVWDDGFSAMTMQEKDLPTFTEGGEWALNSLSGAVVTKLTSNGCFDNVDFKAYVFKKIALYAVKESNIFKVVEIASGYSATHQNTALYTGFTGSIERKTEVALTLGSAECAGRVILCYYDGNGILHNVMPNITGTTVTFTMPAATVELYITDEFSIDLYTFPVTLTADGFSVVDEGDAREDGSFAYTGNIRIYQSNSKSTYNKISVQGAIEGRKVTLDAINQGNNGGKGIEIAEEVKAHFIIRTSATTAPIHLPKSSELIMEGENGTQPEVTILRATIESTYVQIANIDNLKAGVGNVTMKDLTIVKAESKNGSGDASILIYSSSSDKTLVEKAVFDHVAFSPDPVGQYSSSSLTAYVNNVEFINGSKGTFAVASSYTSPIFSSLAKLSIKDSAIYIQSMGAQYGAYGLCTSIEANKPAEVTLDNSTVTYSNRCSDTTVYYETQIINTEFALTLTNNSTFTVERRLRLYSLAMESDSKLTVGTDGGNGYLLCNNITVSGGTLTADYIIASAYALYLKADATESRITAYEDFLLWASQVNSEHRKETGTFTMTGGIVKAKKFIGGAYGATLNIQGGDLSAPAIGSFPAIFGYAAVVPKKDEEPVYQYALEPSACSSTVNITGGTVNVGANGYLGGHNATVNIGGGDVNLDTDAVIGLTNEQCKDAENEATSNGNDPANAIDVAVTISGGIVEGIDGKILTPYGTTQISGADTKVNLLEIVAKRGSVSIQEAKGSYTLTSEETTYQNPLKAGVYVSEQITAEELSITNNAVVYTKNFIADIPAGATGDKTKIKIIDSGILYADTYGIIGDGAYGFEVEGSNDDIRVPVKTIFIDFQLLDDEIDRAAYAAGEENPTSYQTGNEYLVFYNPTRNGFVFDGWYSNPEFTGDKITQIHKSNLDKQRIFYAKWTLVEITFEIVLEGKNFPEIADLDTFDEMGRYDEITKNFTYTHETTVFTLPYRSVLQAEGAVDLDLLFLRPMWAISKLEYDYNGARTPVEPMSTTVDKYILSKAQTNGKFILFVSAVNKTRQRIYFDLNIQNGLPVDAVFVGGIKEADDKHNESSAYVDFGAKLGTVRDFLQTVGDSFMTANAPGYTFVGWSSSVNGESENVADVIVMRDSPTRYYAIWQAKQYTVQFKANKEGATNTYITYDGAKPVDGQEYSVVVAGTIYYDQILNGNLGWKEGTSKESLPTAWTKGYKFLYWEVNGKTVGDSTVFNKTTFEEIAENAGNTTDIALTITAVYEQVTITYDTNGGHWKGSQENTVAAAYGEPLRGIVKLSEVSDGYDTADGKGVEWGVYSTNADSFNGESYVEGDYRYTLVRNGYTFYGWQKEGGETFYWTTPEYEDITVVAQWTANEYTLALYAYDRNKEYEYTDFSHKEGASLNVTVKVNEDLTDNEGLNIDVTNWPEGGGENDWYAYNKSEGVTEDDDKRRLLGFTFAALDPGLMIATATTEDEKQGQAIYNRYAGIVTALINDDLLFEKEKSRFFLPEHYDYGDVTNILDYPARSSIPMYAVYRERSLIFYHYYVDGEGAAQQKEMISLPYRTYFDYPTTYETTAEYNNLIAAQYKLLGWYFHAPIANEANSYTQEHYDTIIGNITGNGSMMDGSYDIKVFTVYVVEVNRDGYTLVSDGKSTGSEAAKGNDHLYTLPGSIQQGQMKFVLTGEDVKNDRINFVSADTLQQYNPNVANNTVAVEIILTNGTQSHNMYLSNAGGTFAQSQQIAGGWQLTFKLYTANVISENQTFTFNLEFSFVDENLKDQKIIFKDMKVVLVPSVYNVTYYANFPNDPNLKIEEEKDFTKEKQIVKTTVNYGADLSEVTPKLEGYTSTDWYHENTEDKAWGRTFSDADNGEISLTLQWTVNEYLLQVDEATLRYWNVYYTPLGGEEETRYVQGDSKVPYHARIRFEANAETTEYYRHKEFVSIAWKDTTTNLLLIEDPFLMVADTVEVTFSDERTLYLENGNIFISEETYEQGSAVTWHGRYIISMTAPTVATNNTLILNGDLTGRTIQLGSLNVTAEDSIKLADDAKVTLTLQGKDTIVTAKNILVPNMASLTIEGEEGKVELTPVAGVAGIGDVNGNGMITLENLNIRLTLPEKSEASGIGSSLNGTGKEITLTSSTVDVTQKETYDIYRGVWFGGKDVEKIIFSESTLTQSGAAPVESYAFYGKEVEIINKSNVTTGASIHAVTGLTVKESKITQNIEAHIQYLPLGTGDGGEIHVENSTIEVALKGGGSWPVDATTLYSGKMLIQDTASEVTINGYKLIEVGNGNVEITDNSTYVLLGNKVGSNNTLTVSGGATVRLDTQADGAVLKSISFEDNPTFIGATDKMLTVNGDFSGTGDLTLQDITVNATGNVGSLGNGSTPTTVSVLGASNIRAATFGALGEHNATFTFVKVAESATISDTTKLVKDHYRIEYDSFKSDNLPTVFRTEMVGGTIAAVNSCDLPAAPNNNSDNEFVRWYYILGGKLYAISGEETTIEGYFDNVKLVANLDSELLTDCGDGTQYVLLYAETTFKGDVFLINGRYFKDFGVTVGTSIDIPADGVFTAMFKVTGANTIGGNYTLTFAEALPAGVKLTLVANSGTNNAFVYYYYITNGGEKEISLNEFTVMGDSTHPDFTVTENRGPTHQDIFILAIDFGSATSATGTTVNLVFAKDSYSKNVEFSYTLMKPTAATVTVSEGNQALEGTVIVTPPENSVDSGKTYRLVAEFSEKVPYDAKITLGDAEGKRIDGNRFVFAVPASKATFTVNGVYGEFTVTWSLVLERESDNVFGKVFATSTKVNFVNTHNKPMLTVAPNANTQVFEQGTGSFMLMFTSSSGDAHTQLQRQQNTLANFVAETENALTKTDNTITIDVSKLTAGVYRVAISLDETFGDSDDVYYTFLVN